MPIVVYRCMNCGTEIEKITKNPNTETPARIANPCAKCRATTKHDKVPTSAAIRTSASTSSVKDTVRSSQRGSQEWDARRNNIKKGLTGDGRPPSDLKEKSAQAWGDAFSSANPRLEEAKKELGRE